MSTTTTKLRKELLAELDALPPEFHSLLLQMIRTYRESVTLRPAAATFATGWREAMRGKVHSISSLWEGIDAK